MVQTPASGKQEWARDAIIILFMLLNTWLIMSGHQSLDTDVLKVSDALQQTENAQCPVTVNNHPLTRIHGRITSMSHVSPAKTGHFK